MYIVKYNLINIKYNPTNNSVGEYKCMFKILSIKEERGANLSEIRLSETVSTNLMQQLGLLKSPFDK